jgi:hypothetical protein
MKRVEEERILHILKKTDFKSAEEDDGPSNLAAADVSALCEDLVADEEEYSSEHDIGPQPSSPKKQKKTRLRKVYDHNNLRRSNRKRIKKIY